MGIEKTIKGAKRGVFDHIERLDPGDMTGQAGKLLAVKGTEDGLELIDAPSGSGLVDSVFGRVGAVVKQAGDYTAADITETVALKIMTAAERTKLAAIEDGATADQTGAEIEALIDSELGTAAWKSGGTGYVAADYTALAGYGVAATGEVAVVTGDYIAGVFRSTNRGGSALAANGGTVIAHAAGGNYRWERVFQGNAVSAGWWGYTGAGVVDDTAALQAAIDARVGAVFVPPSPPGSRGGIISQILVRQGVRLFGASTGRWGFPGSRLRQKNGSNVSMIVADPAITSTEYLHEFSMHDLFLEGRWVNAPAGPTDGTCTAGCGIELTRRMGETCKIYNVHARFWPESGIRIARGTTPGSIENCSSFWNGAYGFDFESPSGDIWHQFNANMLSGDDNEVALIRVKTAGNRFDSVSLGFIKGETKIAGKQQDLIVLENMNYATVYLYGLSQQNVGTTSNALVRNTSASGCRVLMSYWRASSECANVIQDQFNSKTMANTGSASQAIPWGYWDSSRNNPDIHVKTKDNFYVVDEVTQRAAAAPTTGTHYRGEFVWNSAPSAGGVLGWSCTAAGTPGTWTAVTLS